MTDIRTTVGGDFEAYDPMVEQLRSLSSTSGSGQIYLQKVMNLGSTSIYLAATVTGSTANSAPVEAEARAEVASDSEIRAPKVVETNVDADTQMTADAMVHMPTSFPYFAEHHAELFGESTTNNAVSISTKLDAETDIISDSVAVSSSVVAGNLFSATQANMVAAIKRGNAISAQAMVFAKMHVMGTLDPGGYESIPVHADVRLGSDSTLQSWDRPVRNGTTLYIRQVHQAATEGTSILLT